MGSTATATATREIFYLVEQPGRFLFKAGATNDWEAATAALSAGPAWRSCITARVNNADQLCRLIDRKYSDRLHGDSGWLALMPDQIQFVRSLALKAGDDFRRANPGCSASPPKQPRKARKAPAAAKPKPAGTKAPEPKKGQPADGPYWGQEAARRAANEARAKADQHWKGGANEAQPKADQHSANRAAEPQQEARSQSKAAPAPGAAASEEGQARAQHHEKQQQAPNAQPSTYAEGSLRRSVLLGCLFLFGGPTLGLLLVGADSLLRRTPTGVEAQAVPSLTAEQALAAIDRRQAADQVKEKEEAEARWRSRQIQTEREEFLRKARLSKGEELIASLDKTRRQQAEAAKAAAGFGCKGDAAAQLRCFQNNAGTSSETLRPWLDVCVGSYFGGYLQHKELCDQVKEKLMANAATRQEVGEAEYKVCKRRAALQEGQRNFIRAHLAKDSLLYPSEQDVPYFNCKKP